MYRDNEFILSSHRYFSSYTSYIPISLSPHPVLPFSSHISLTSSPLYSKATYSIPKSVLSIFRLHNETGNIWTHILGALLFTFVITRITPAHTNDDTAVLVYFISCVSCFAASAMYVSAICITIRALFTRPCSRFYAG